MTWLFIGLLIFIALHSLRSHAESFRNFLISQVGLLPFRIVYSLLTLIALYMIGLGLVESRNAPIMLWQPNPDWRQIMGIGMWFVALGVSASWVPGTFLRARLKQPLLLAIVLWSLLHLSVSAYAHQWVIYITILMWGLSVLWRDWSMVPAPGIAITRDLLAVILATILWLLFGFYLHAGIIGVPVYLF